MPGIPDRFFLVRLIVQDKYTTDFSYLWKKSKYLEKWGFKGNWDNSTQSTSHCWEGRSLGKQIYLEKQVSSCRCWKPSCITGLKDDVTCQCLNYQWGLWRGLKKEAEEEFSLHFWKFIQSRIVSRIALISGEWLLSNEIKEKNKCEEIT